MTTVQAAGRFPARPDAPRAQEIQVACLHGALADQVPIGSLVQLDRRHDQSLDLQHPTETTNVYTHLAPDPHFTVAPGAFAWIDPFLSQTPSRFSRVKML